MTTVSVELQSDTARRLLLADQVCEHLVEHGGILDHRGSPAMSLAFAKEAQEKLEAYEDQATAEGAGPQ